MRSARNPLFMHFRVIFLLLLYAVRAQAIIKSKERGVEWRNRIFAWNEQKIVNSIIVAFVITNFFTLIIFSHRIHCCSFFSSLLFVAFSLFSIVDVSSFPFCLIQLKIRSLLKKGKETYLVILSPHGNPTKNEETKREGKKLLYQSVQIKIKMNKKRVEREEEEGETNGRTFSRVFEGVSLSGWWLAFVSISRRKLPL